MHDDLTYPKRSHPAPPRDGDKQQARLRVNYYVKAGRLPRPDTLRCAECGARASEYDHHLGYGAEHHLDVRPVCHSCNIRADFRRGDRSGPKPRQEVCDVCGEARPNYRHGRCNRCRLYWKAHGVERPTGLRS